MRFYDGSRSHSFLLLATFIVSLFPERFPVSLLPFNSPVCDPFCAKSERIGCLGRIAVDVSPPGNFEIPESRLCDF
jgi:hypothetical protein